MRFRPRFTIRTLLMGIAILAIPLTWFSWEQSIAWERRRLDRLLRGTSSLQVRQDGIGYPNEKFDCEVSIDGKAHYATINELHGGPSWIGVRFFNDVPIRAFLLSEEIEEHKAEYQSAYPEATVLVGADFEARPARHMVCYVDPDPDPKWKHQGQPFRPGPKRKNYLTP